METLVQASMKLGEAIYKSQQNNKPDSGKDDDKDNKDKKDANGIVNVSSKDKGTGK